jgi:hypothetical protein
MTLLTQILGVFARLFEVGWAAIWLVAILLLVRGIVWWMDREQ